MIFREDMRAVLDTAGGADVSGLKFRVYSVLLLFQNSGALAVFLFRVATSLASVPVVGRHLGLIVDRFNQFFNGVQVPCGARIGPGFQIKHPHSVVIAQNLVAGENLVIVGPATTVGWSDLEGGPEGQEIEFGDNVTISAGARLLGPLKIGDNVTIGPNVILMENVPSDSTVISSARAKVFKLGADGD